jgi:hypothetical protein
MQSHDGDAVATLQKGRTMTTRTDQQLAERAWDVALGHYLAHYPTEKTPEEIMSLLKAESEEVTYWEPFEYSDPQWIAEHIESMQRYILGELQWARGDQ